VAGVGASGIFDVSSWTREWERALRIVAHAAFDPGEKKKERKKGSSSWKSVVGGSAMLGFGHVVVSTNVS